MESNHNLEKYLETIYLRECICPISQAEVNFIREGIEDQIKQYLEQTYSGIRTPCTDEKCEISHKQSDFELLKVGSFYEGTKNGFPDEFDFIAVLGTVDKIPVEDYSSHLQNGTICSKCTPYTSNDFQGAEISFHFTFGTRNNGNAQKLEFFYKKGDHQRIIMADVAIGLRCNSLEYLHLEEKVFRPKFYQEITKTGRVLLIYTGRSSSSVNTLPTGEKVVERSGPWDVSITETEVRFIREVLSGQHRTVYRILKYLINGPFGEDLFKHFDLMDIFMSECMPFPATFCLSSYAIKIALIHHHYSCDSVTALGNCVIKVLKYILTIFNTPSTDRGMIFMYSILNNGPCVAVGNFQFLTSFYWCLKAFVFRLESLQNGKVQKCDHEFENSLQEMALRLPIFKGFIEFLKTEAEQFANPRILWYKKPNLGVVVQKVEKYLEQRKRVPFCSWCDFEELLGVPL